MTSNQLRLESVNIEVEDGTLQVAEQFVYQQVDALEGADVAGVVAPILAEAERRAPRDPSTVYLGGGTPSLLPASALRELLGSGSLLGYTVFTSVADGGSFHPIGIMVLAPGAFFLIGFLIWGVRSWKPAQVEEPEYRIHAVHRAEVV